MLAYLSLDGQERNHEDFAAFEESWPIGERKEVYLILIG